MPEDKNRAVTGAQIVFRDADNMVIAGRIASVSFGNEKAIVTGDFMGAFLPGLEYSIEAKPLTWCFGDEVQG